MKKILGIGLILSSTGLFAASPGLFFGYVDYTSANQPSLASAVSHGYNAVVVSFAEVNGSEADLNNLNPTYAQTLQSDIATAHASGAKVLISFGGQNNTFNPNSADPTALANSIYDNVLEPYGFDGVDFDLESVNYSASYIESLITDLQSIAQAHGKTLIITGAPQISAWIKNDSGMIGLQPLLWNELATSGLFNYLLIQDYNQFGGAQIYNASGTLLEENNPGFIAASYDYLMNPPIGVTRQFSLTANTQIVIGEPASSEAGHGLNNPEDIDHDFACLQSGKNCVAYQPSRLYPNAASLMTWSIGHDATDVNWGFAHGVSACVVNGKCN